MDRDDPDRGGDLVSSKDVLRSVTPPSIDVGTVVASLLESVGRCVIATPAMVAAA
jgi:hypothetical protein